MWRAKTFYLKEGWQPFWVYLLWNHKNVHEHKKKNDIAIVYPEKREGFPFKVLLSPHLLLSCCGPSQISLFLLSFFFFSQRSKLLSSLSSFQVYYSFLRQLSPKCRKPTGVPCRDYGQMWTAASDSEPVPLRQASETSVQKRTSKIHVAALGQPPKKSRTINIGIPVTPVMHSSLQWHRRIAQ